mgnify:CR=1
MYLPYRAGAQAMRDFVSERVKTVPPSGIR